MHPEDRQERVPQAQGNIGFAILGFCIPLVGLILFLVWNTDRPADAKYAGIGALVSVGLSIVFFILSVVLGGLAAGM